MRAPLAILLFFLCTTPFAASIIAEVDEMTTMGEMVTDDVTDATPEVFRICFDEAGVMSTMNDEDMTAEEVADMTSFISTKPLPANFPAMYNEFADKDSALTVNGKICVTPNDTRSVVCPATLTDKAITDSRLYPFGVENGDINHLIEDIENLSLWERIYYLWRCKKIVYKHTYFSTASRKCIYVCDNGYMSSSFRWKWSYPTRLTHWLATYVGVNAPFWMASDASLFQFSPCKERKSKLFTHVYDRSDADTTVLDMATQQVNASQDSVTGFVGRRALVVTWVDMPPNQLWVCQLVAIGWLQNRYDDCSRLSRTVKANTFQAIVVTDDTYTFLIIIYPLCGLEWSHPQLEMYTEQEKQALMEIIQTGYAVIGVASDRNSPIEHIDANPVSGSYAAKDLDDPDRETNTGIPNTWIMRMDLNSEETPLARCNNWLDAAEQDDLDFSRPNVSVVRAMKPCPPNVWAAIWDMEFRQYWSYSYNSDTRRVRFALGTYFRDMDGNRYLHICAYGFTVGGGGWFTLLTSPSFDGSYMNYRDQVGELDNFLGYALCCVESTESCSEFRALRGTGSGIGYVPPLITWGLGDPHITTLDGLEYTFNGLGEFIYFMGPNATVHGRTTEVVTDGGQRATVWSGFAMEDVAGEVIVQISSKATTSNSLVDKFDLIVNGSAFDLAPITNTTTFYDGVGITETSEGRLTIQLPSGVGCTFNTVASMTSMLISCTIPNQLKANIVGLAGVPDGDTSNDLQYPNGTVLSPNSTDDEIFPLGLEWRVSEMESLFMYDMSNTYASYNNLTYEPTFAKDLQWESDAARTAAEDSCGTNSLCLFDAAITGDLSFGESTKELTNSETENSEQLANAVPSIIGPSFFRVEQSSVAVTINVNISDDKGASGLSFETVPAGSVVTQVSGDMYTWTFTVGDTAGLELQLIVQDSMGAAASYKPLVALCNCVNGNCTQLSEGETQAAATSSNTVYEECTCSQGYDGVSCNADLDACATRPDACFEGSTGGCIDDPAPAGADGYTCGPCPTGMTGDGTYCEPINECEATPGPCSTNQQCLDIREGFVCACVAGYVANSAGDCEDTNECATLFPCHQVCTNTPGSFTCSCDAEYTLNSDNINCDADNPCTGANPCDPDQGQCRLVGGTPTCSCNKGYEVNADNSSICSDVNECSSDPCDEDCTNTAGGFTCSCGAGKTLDANGFGCIDTNECFFGTHNCNATQQCVNTAGSFDCQCAEGTRDNGDGTCTGLTDSERPADAAPNATDLQRSAAVSVTVYGLSIDNYTRTVDQNVKRAIATAANDVCESADGCRQVTSSRRRKRSGHSTFTMLHVYRVDGYPQDVNDTTFILSVYVDTGTFLLDAQDLVLAMDNAAAALSTALGGATLGSATVLIGTTPTPEPSSTSTALPWWVWLLVAIGAVLIIVLIVLIVLLILNQKSKGKVTQHDDDPPPTYHGEPQHSHKE